ncbi:MAG: flagellar export chaperone FliS [Nitrospinaceae bacterium]|nr:flagellar export chaperone FliS [Nitrospinaceae bacterium]NIR54688.1 flagellar export chaperone FliS [Nitrospinaceae bacterium]NIS85106.1 flagellar export chaperone FliS [Nitrospinaceae bacterium]NIT81923.1 flagellar export chaperone FliS [Nitrospinaceae bacterium]NIU44187.1 flagellar export chaperone FliS [Nitrospinaceae bacterium]
MVSSRYFKEYKQNEISTSSQGKLILMMYEGAIRFTQMAIQCLDQGDLAGKGLYIRKTHDIINELSVSLDLKKGGEVAARLETLYNFALSQLTRANIKSDRQALESILKVLKPLHEAWEHLFQTPAPPQDSSPPSKNITSRC